MCWIIYSAVACVFVFGLFLFFFTLSLSVLLPAKTEVCLDSLIPGLEPPQAQLYPVEAEPASLALAGKNVHQRWTSLSLAF